LILTLAVTCSLFWLLRRETGSNLACWPYQNFSVIPSGQPETT